MAINIAEAALHLTHSLPHYQCSTGRFNQCAVNAFNGSHGGPRVVISILLHISVCPPPRTPNLRQGEQIRSKDVNFIYKVFIYI